MDLAEQFQRAEQYFFDGKLKECADLCQQMLNANPNFAHGYYLMGALFKTTGNFEKAVQFSDLAIKFAPNVAVFYLQRGHSQFILNNVDGAASSLQRACDLDPNSAVAFMLLADCYSRLGRFDEALTLFDKAKKLQDIPEIDEHKGLCLHMKGDLAAAEIVFGQVVSRRPDYDWGYIHLGKVQGEMRKVVESEANFNTALSLNPFAYEAMLSLAQIHKMRGKLTEAIDLVMRASQVQPQLIQCYIALGELFVLASRMEDAEQAYRKALTIEPENIYAIEGLANVLVNFRRTEEALSYLDRALANNPNNQSLQYLRSVLRGEKLAAPPKEYVSKLFDDYADRFEQHLQQTLSYSTPEQLAQCVREVVVEDKRTGTLSLLDLGCGTGLGAEALVELTRERVGVDLSAKMVEKARTKNLYAELRVGDIVDYALGTTRRFDLVAAVDVLVYIGDLNPLFGAARHVLSPSGLFAFSVESGPESQPYTLSQSVRYSHARSYVHSLAETHGLVIRKEHATVLRHDQGKPVDGVIYILQKPSPN